MRYKFIMTISLIILFAFCLGCIQESSNGHYTEDLSQTELAQIERIHNNMSPSDIPILMQIITSEADSIVRERAIVAVTDIALSSNRTDEIVPTLKEVALYDKNSTVRRSAYSHVYLIRDLHPPDRIGDLVISITGDLREGEEIMLTATLLSSENVETALFGIKKIAERDKEFTDGIEILGSERMPYKFSLAAGEEKKIPIKLHLLREGEYLIKCLFQIDIDRIDYQLYEKDIFIKVEKATGKYEIVDASLYPFF